MKTPTSARSSSICTISPQAKNRLKSHKEIRITAVVQCILGRLIGETIVRRILTSEVEISLDYASTDFSADNYDFRFLIAKCTWL